MTDQIERPVFIKDRHLEFLDGLNEEGRNMYDSNVELESNSALTRKQALETMRYWMATQPGSSSG